MQISYTKDEITFEKELNKLDEFTIEFTEILNQLKIKYVIVSGYVAILFGRSRSSEDIDLILEKLNYDSFKKMWTTLQHSFECIISKDSKTAYEEYLTRGNAIRFSRKNSFIPNIEIKFPKTELDAWTLNNRKKVTVNGKKMFISPLELQIPFKLYLGSEKDIEDAKHLYLLFKTKLDLDALKGFNRKLKVEEAFSKYLE